MNARAERLARKIITPMGFFRDGCRLLWGDQWQSACARALGVSLRLVQHWHAGTRRFQPEHAQALAALLDERRLDLGGCRDELMRIVRQSERKALEMAERARRKKAMRERRRRRIMAAMREKPTT